MFIQDFLDPVVHGKTLSAFQPLPARDTDETQPLQGPPNFDMTMPVDETGCENDEDEVVPPTQPDGDEDDQEEEKPEVR